MSSKSNTALALRTIGQVSRLHESHCLRAAKVSRTLAGNFRNFSSSKASLEEPVKGQYVGSGSERWRATPSRMRAPVSLKKRHPENEYRVNEDPRVLDETYKKVLGEDGDKLLSEDVKWLAVTHKSFDQGRRGYNDRLAFFGKRLVDLQTSLALLNRTDGTFVDPPDEHQREVFRHPGVDLLSRLTQESKSDMLALPRVANLAHSLGLLTVARWKPRQADDLRKSGVDRVLSQTLYAIIGAVALQNGSEVAIRIVRQSLLRRLGLDV